MKKKWSIWLVVAGMTVSLAACQPKEEPTALSSKSLTDFFASAHQVETSTTGSLVLEKSIASINPALALFSSSESKTIPFTMHTIYDSTKQWSSQQMQTELPIHEQSIPFSLTTYTDKKTSTTYINGKDVSDVVSPLSTLLTQEDTTSDETSVQSDIATSSTFLIEQLQQTYLSAPSNSSLFDNHITKEQYVQLAKSLPASAFSYEKKKQGEYGHISITLSDTQFKKWMTLSKKKDDTPSFYLADVSSPVSVTWSNVQLDVIINKEKQPVSIEMKAVMNMNNTTTHRLQKLATYHAVTSFNTKPTTTIPAFDATKKVIPLSNLQPLLDTKIVPTTPVQ